MSDLDAFNANIQRGSLLLDQDRPREALPFIQGAIAADPENARGYAELARCWNGLPGQRSKVIPAIDAAIGRAPNVSFYYGRKGWYLVCQMRFHAALAAAKQGLAIDPACIHSLNATANAYTKLGRWREAEAACRRILEIDPDDDPGLNLLAQALRHRGKWKESRETVARLLAQMPNNAFGHANAGYSALAAGDHLRANEHFLESLRMEPQSEIARRGLLQSLRARIWIIRFNARVTSLLHRPPTVRNLALMFLSIAGFLVGCLGLGLLFDHFHSDFGFELLGFAIMGSLLYVYLSFLVVVLGNFLLLFDPLGRHALTTAEKIKACIPAAAFAGVVVMMILSGVWKVALGLMAFLGFLALSIQYPLLKDRRDRRQGRG